jgi:hypothetical protein
VACSAPVGIHQLRRFGRERVGVRTKAAQSYRAQEDTRDTTVVISSFEEVVEREEGGSGSRDTMAREDARLIDAINACISAFTRLELKSLSRPGQHD